MSAAKLATAEDVTVRIYFAVTDESDTFRYPIGNDIEPLLEARTSLPEEQYVQFMRKQFMPEF